MSKKVANASAHPVTVRLVKRAGASVGFSDGIKPAGAVDDSVELSFNLGGYTPDDGRFVIASTTTPNLKNPQNYIDIGDQFTIDTVNDKVVVVGDITTNETDPNYVSRTFGLFFRLKSTDGLYALASPQPTQAVVDYKNVKTYVPKTTIIQSVGQWFNDSHYYVPLYLGTLKELYTNWTNLTAMGLPDLATLGKTVIYNEIDLTVDLPLESVTITNVGDFVIGSTVSIGHTYMPEIAKITNTEYSVDNTAIAEFVAGTNQLVIKTMGTVNVTVKLTDNIGNEMSTVKSFNAVLDFEPLIAKYTVNNTLLQIQLAGVGEGATDGYVDWGDGILEPVNGDLSHQYVGAASRTVKVWLTEPVESLTLAGNNALTEIAQWGDVSFPTLTLAGNTALTKVPTAAPAGLTNAYQMFQGCSNFNQNLNGWDMSAVTVLESMFEGASSFNGLIDTWNVGNVERFNSMFADAISFNRNINNWDMVKATNLDSMFANASSFNQPVNTWRPATDAVATNMFSAATSFNQPLTGLVSANLSSVDAMLKGCSSFNQDLSSLSFRNGISLNSFLENCTGFNGKLGNLGGGTFSAMSNMLKGCSTFNQPVIGIDFSTVTDVSSLFEGCAKFNQPLNTIDVGAVTHATNMFKGCSVFTSDLSQWDVSNLQAADGMFEGTANFDSNLSWWCVSNLPSAPARFAQGSFLATSNLPVWGTCPVQNVVVDIVNKTPFMVTGESGTLEVTFDKPVTVTDFSWVSSNPDALAINGVTGDYSVIDAGGATITVTVNGLYTTTRSYETLPTVIPTILNVKGIEGIPLTVTLDENSTRGNDCWMDWGDGTYDRLTYANPTATHRHAVDAVVQVKAVSTGLAGSGLILNGNGVLAVVQWGDTDLEIHSEGLISVPESIPSTVTKVKFIDCINFNDPNIVNWNVSSITNFSRMFDGCLEFDQPIGNWDTSNGVEFDRMFADAMSFNHPIGDWNVSATYSMNSMFNGATLFNQNLNWWCLTNITSIPQDFKLDSALTEANLPTWGACPNPVYTLTIDPVETMMVDGTQLMNYSLLPESNVQQSVWASDNEAIITFNGGSVAQAVAPGTVTVTLTVNKVYVATIDITVAAPTVPYTFSTFVGMPTMVENKGATDISVDWGDGNTEVIAVGAAAVTHEYTEAVQYIAKILPVSGDVLDGVVLMQGVAEIISWFSGTQPSLQLVGNAVSRVPETPPNGLVNATNMFKACPYFNQDISMWDMSNVTNMSSMFFMATAFNQPLETWNVSNVTDMADMFFGATVFNQPLNGWNVGAVTNMVDMFYSANAFNQPLNNWDVSKVTSMHSMFRYNSAFNGDIGNWNVSAVTNMDSMFENTSVFDKPLNGWNVSSVTTMKDMFRNAIAFNQPLNNWDVSNVTEMRGIFAGAVLFDGDIATWDIQSLTSLENMFNGATAFNQTLNLWNTENVTSMIQLFKNASTFNQPLNLWNVSNVASMPGMFDGATAFNQELISWCVANISTEPSNFKRNSALTPANEPVWGACPSRTAVTLISNIPPTSIVGDNYNLEVSVMDNSTPIEVVTEVWSVSDSNKAIVTEVGEITLLAPGEVTVKVRVNGVYTAETTLTIEPPPPTPMTLETTGTELEISAYSPIVVTIEGGATFTPAGQNEGGLAKYTLIHTFPDNAPRRVTVASVNPANPITSVRLTKGVSKVIDWCSVGHSTIVQGIATLSNVGRLPATITQVPAQLHPSITNLSNMFAGAVLFNQNISGWDTSNVTNMSGMFSGATAFNQDISGWDVSKVTIMEYMFASTGAFNQPIGSWNVSAVSNMVSMFSGAQAFNQPLDNWDVSSVVTTRNMFASSVAFNQDLPNWNVSNLIIMDGMFSDSVAFNGNISNWNTGNVTAMSGLLQGAKAFNQPLNGWNTSKVTNMSWMFASNTAFDQPLNSWNTGNVTKMSGMFNNNNKFDKPIGSWNVANVNYMDRMFEGSTYLNRQNLSQWCVGRIGGTPSNFCPNNYSYQNWPVWGTCPRGEDGTAFEMQFTTNAGELSYRGKSGDSIVLSNGTILQIGNDEVHTEIVPAGVNVFKFAQTRIGDPLVPIAIAGEALVEVNSFPKAEAINFICFNTTEGSPNLVKVPTTLPTNIRSLRGMFYKATSFNQNISGWNTSNITDMAGCFNDATSFNKPLNTWTLTSVTDMTAMFSGASSFNQTIDFWNVSTVTSMDYMFKNATAFNQNLATWWCVSNIPTMPLDFAYNAPLMTAEKLPVWGTCPPR